MRLEGRSGPLRAQLRKADVRAYHAYHVAKCTVVTQCTVDYICPPDWCHAIRDVASASELAAASTAAQERDDVASKISCRLPAFPMRHAACSRPVVTTELVRNVETDGRGAQSPVDAGISAEH